MIHMFRCLGALCELAHLVRASFRSRSHIQTLCKFSVRPIVGLADTMRSFSRSSARDPNSQSCAKSLSSVKYVPNDSPGFGF